jgi:cytochrome c oxidase subunit 2
MIEFLERLGGLFLGMWNPEAASTYASDVDTVFNGVFVISIVSFMGLMGVMTYFIFRYHKKVYKEKAAYIPHNTLAEALWTIIPTFIFVGIAVWGWVVYDTQVSVPDNAMKMKIVGKQWDWEYKYAHNGLNFSTTGIMYVPVNTPVEVELTSVDVIHSFFIPSFRIKQDAVPGIRTRMWFEATKKGDFQVFCTEYCGTSHSRMGGTVRVVSKERFNQWISREAEEANISDPVALGERHFNAKGCTSCHAIDGSRLIGPPLNGLWGKNREFENADAVVADAAYIRESILNPNVKVVKGYPAKMNSFQGQLSEEEIDHVIEYIKSLK